MTQNKLNKFLGFQINDDLQHIIQNIPNPEKKQILVEQQNLRDFDSKEFFIKINRKQMIKDLNLPKNISKIELAFYASFDPKRTILNDGESNAQKNIENVNFIKNNQPNQENPINENKSQEQEKIIDNEQSSKINDSQNQDLDVNLQMYCRIDCQFNRQYRENGDFMINCCNSQCDQWFHPKCIGLGDITPDDAKKIFFYCSDYCKLEKKNRNNQRLNNKKKIKYC